jgi:hypothetical protein
VTALATVVRPDPDFFLNNLNLSPGDTVHQDSDRPDHPESESRAPRLGPLNHPPGGGRLGALLHLDLSNIERVDPYLVFGVIIIFVFS